MWKYTWINRSESSKEIRIHPAVLLGNIFLLFVNVPLHLWIFNGLSSLYLIFGKPITSLLFHLIKPEWMSFRVMDQRCRLHACGHSPQRVLLHPQRRPAPPDPGRVWDGAGAHDLQPPGARALQIRTVDWRVAESAAGDYRRKITIFHLLVYSVE